MINNLNSLILELSTLGITVKWGEFQIGIYPDLKKFNLIARNLIYALLNNFEKKYFIFIEGLPYCLFPEADDHVIYNKKPDVYYSRRKTCLSCKYSALCPGWPKNAINKKIAPLEIPDLPKEIVVEVTQDCNQNCLLCFSARKKEEVPILKIKEIIGDCKTLGINTIRFSGGEPLLYNPLEEALFFAKKNGLYVLLNTNATLLTRGNLNSFNKSVDNALISMQGYDSKSERRLTRTNINFKEKIANIATLSRYIPITRIGSIISRTLIGEWPNYIRLINKLEPRTWELYRPMTDSDNPEFNISKSSMIDVMGLIKKSGLAHTEIRIANPVPFCITPDLASNSKILVGANADDGHSRIIFDSAGYFKPSYVITKKIGTAIEDSWSNPFLQKIRSLCFLPAKCKGCFYLKWCKGGSRYWARISNGDYFAMDPMA
ncbi:MAG: radical SAM protein [Candidatus Omnitrophota bacterium]